MARVWGRSEGGEAKRGRGGRASDHSSGRLVAVREMRCPLRSQEWANTEWHHIMLDTFGHMQYLYGNTVGIASTFYFDSNSGFLLDFSWQYLGLRFWRSVIICNSEHTEFGWIWTNQTFWIIYGQSWLSWIALDNVYIFSLYYISYVSFLFSKANISTEYPLHIH